ncbi:MAG: metalloregulator ArsR/SmtB family transcription factor [Devosia sp.]
MTRNASVTTASGKRFGTSMPPLPVLIALADPTRCRIIEILRDGPQPVHVLAGSFDISRPAISRHLRVLKQARLISEKKAGRENRYALHSNKLKPVRDWLDTLVATSNPVGRAAAAPSAVVAPEAATVSVAVLPKPVREKAVSQMGFDF